MGLIIFCLLSLKFFSVPWFWVFLATTIYIFILAFEIKKQSIKIALFTALSIPIALLLCEAYFYFTPGNKNIISSGTYVSEGFSESNDILGYAPKHDIQRTLKHVFDDEVIYDVVYTIDNNGLRNTPSSNITSNRYLLFFGGSFTFGEGLNDNETLPFFVGEEVKYKIYNFGFPGYGPHQTLSAIENGLVDNVVKRHHQNVAIYSCLPSHIARVAGYSPWDSHGPKYIIDNGNLYRKGHFDSNSSNSINRCFLFRKTTAQIKKSFIYKKIIFSRKYKTNKEQEDLFFSIIDRARVLLKEQYHVSRFIILFWDSTNLSSDIGNKNSEALIKRFSEGSYEYYLVGDILDNYSNDRGYYSVSPHDNHPNSDANRQLAKFLVRKLNN